VDLTVCRDGNLIKQQQLAMKLLKMSGGKEQYQWWVILSIMLQVCVPALTLADCGQFLLNLILLLIFSWKPAPLACAQHHH